MILPADWLVFCDPALRPRLGRVRHVLFDFDGTLSTLRQGWEPVMSGVMIEAICAGQPPAPEIETEVREYVDRSTGILTILQMEWLAEAVRRHGLAANPCSAGEYKRIYLERLMLAIAGRLAAVGSGAAPPWGLYNGRRE